MLNTRLSLEARNSQLDALAALADSGYLRIYSGAQPATPDDPATGTLLAELRLGSPAFDPASGGAIITTPITAEPDAKATGIAAWFRVLKSDGVSPLFDGSIGTGGTNIIVNSTSVQIHATVSVESYTHGLPMQGT